MKRLIIPLITLLLFLTTLFSYVGVKNNVTEKASFGRDYAIVRVFDKDGFSQSEISDIRFTAEAASTADVGDNGRLWCDAYSYFTETSVSRPDGNPLKCKAIVTGGDFFLFHELEFKHGWHYTSTDAHLDRVVIDEKLAFELFGSNDVEDMQIVLGTKTLYVAGVVSLDESEAKELQLGTEPLIYIPESVAVDLFGERQFDFYEIMMQNPLSSHAVNSLATVTEGKEVVDHTGRYKIKSIFKLIKDFPTRSYRTEAVSYPYWENASRGVEDILAILLIANAITSMTFIISVGTYFIERKKR